MFSVAQILRLGSWEPLISVGLGQKHTRACTHTIRQTHTHSNTQTQWRAWLAGEALSPLHSGSPLSGLSRQLRTGWKQPKLRKKSLSVLSFLIIAARQSKLSQIFWAYGYYVFIHINLYEQISPYECRIWRKVAGFWGRGCSGQSSIDQSRLSGLWLHAGEQRKRGARRLKCDLGTLQLMSDDDLRFYSLLVHLNYIHPRNSKLLNWPLNNERIHQKSCNQLRCYCATCPSLLTRRAYTFLTFYFELIL